MKIGFLGFGGGNALIPIIEEELVKKRKLVTTKELNDQVMIAVTTAGAMPLQIVSGVGEKVSGVLGMILAPVAISIPGCILMLLLLCTTTYLPKFYLNQFQYLAIAVEIYIISVLIVYIGKSITQYNKNKYKFGAAIIVLAVGISSFIFNINSIVIMLLYFSCVYINEIKRKSGNYVSNELNVKPKGRMLKGFFTWLVVVGIVGILSLLLTRSVDFFLKSILSIVFSFGGGDAYLTMAHSIFVDGELLNETVFYNEIVPYANLLPGSIMCKVLLGAGKNLYELMDNSLFLQISVGIIGYVLAVSVSCLLFHGVKVFYEGIRNKTALETTTKWIKPVVSGLLIGVIISIMKSAYIACIELKLNSIFFLFVIILVFMNIILNYKTRLGHGSRIVITIAIVMLFSNCI